MDYRAALADTRAGLWTPAAARLRSEVERSIDKLVQLRDGEGHPSTRLRAAVSIIELATKLHELANVGPQIAAMEFQLAELSERASSSRASPDDTVLDG